MNMVFKSTDTYRNTYAIGRPLMSCVRQSAGASSEEHEQRTMKCRNNQSAFIAKLFSLVKILHWWLRLCAALMWEILRNKQVKMEHFRKI